MARALEVVEAVGEATSERGAHGRDATTYRSKSRPHPPRRRPPGVRYSSSARRPGASTLRATRERAGLNVRTPARSVQATGRPERAARVNREANGPRAIIM